MPKKCQMCGKKVKLFKVHTDKGVTEWWCNKCIDEEESYKFQPNLKEMQDLGDTGHPHE